MIFGYKKTKSFDLVDFYDWKLYYLRVTEAPASSNLALSSSASAAATPSLITFGAPSTSSLASLRPRPVISRTTLITPTFLSPAAVNSTSNESLAAAASPAPAAATATGAAAVHQILLR